MSVEILTIWESNVNVVQHIILYNMYNKVSSTELKQNTRKVLELVKEEPDNPVVVYNYNEPTVVIINYDKWQEQNRDKERISLEELKREYIRDFGVIDSVKEIRKMRDEE